MGRWFETTYLSWKEPSSFRLGREAEYYKACLRTVSPRTAGAYAGIFMLLRTLVWLLGRHPLPWLAFGFLGDLGAGLCCGYGGTLLSWFRDHLFAAPVRVTDRGVGDWGYRELLSYRIVSIELDAWAVTVLDLKTAEGGNLIVGIDPSVPLEELARVLAGRGVQVEGAASPTGPWAGEARNCSAASAAHRPRGGRR
jgi:hypothetical protein